MGRTLGGHLGRSAAAACLAVMLVACGGGGGGASGGGAGAAPSATVTSAPSASSAPETTAPQTFRLEGSVGDGPIVAARVRAYDADGRLLGETTSDALAGYALEVPVTATMPVVVVADGGRDLVTGRGADFPLRAVVFSPGLQTLNLSPYTTLALALTQCADAVDADGLAGAWETLDAQLNLGWRMELIADPMGFPVDRANAATVLLANEALGEVLRRTTRAFAAAPDAPTERVVLDSLACDLADGTADGVGASDARLAVTTFAALASVQLEVIAGALRVDGQGAGALMDAALVQTMPGSGSVKDVQLPGTLLAQAADSLAVLQGLIDAELLLEARLAVSAGPEEARALVGSLLSGVLGETLRGVAGALATGPDETVAGGVERLAALAMTGPPALNLNAPVDVVAEGDTTTVSWSSTGADECLAAGAWQGLKAPQGSESVQPGASASEYRLACFGLGGVATASVAISLRDPEPPAAGSAADGDVLQGDPEPENQNDEAPGSGPLSDDGTPPVSEEPSPAAEEPVEAEPAAAPDGVEDPVPDADLPPEETPDPFVPEDADAPKPEPSDSSDSAAPEGTGAPDEPDPPAERQEQQEQQEQQDAPLPEDEPVPETEAPAPEPTLSFAADENPLASGERTRLRWTSTGADGCEAEGAWGGSRAAEGDVRIGPLEAATTYTLSCSGAGGNVVAMLQVTVLGDVTLSWVAPTENEDGTPLEDLVAYRIYFGTSSRDYFGMIEIDDVTAASRDLTLESGTYYLAMTALDADGNESDYSNEVVRIVP